MESLFFRLAAALATPDISSKLTLTASLADDWKAGRLDWRDPTPVDLVCGRPEKPELVPPKLVPQRSPTTEEGRAEVETQIQVQADIDDAHDWRLQLTPADTRWRLKGRLPRQQYAARLAPSVPAAE